MIRLKSKEEIELIRESSLLIGKTLAEVAKHLLPGITTAKLDKIAEEFILDHKAIPTFKGYNGFPAALCISVNDVVVHGIPGKQVVQEGDIVSIDCGVTLNGFVGDSAYTFTVGEVSSEVQNLLRVTKEALYLGIEKAVEGNRIGDIGHAIQAYVEQHSYSVVRELCGHGVGFKLHEKPDVPNFGRQGNGTVLKEGLVIAIEPMVNMGVRNVRFEKDGWTVRTADKKPSAHFEHTLVVGKITPDILSSFEEIEKQDKK